MRRQIAPVWVVVVCLVAATASVADAGIVPVSMQRAIPMKVPAGLRYVPTELPLGYRYAKSHGARSGLDLLRS